MMRLRGHIITVGVVARGSDMNTVVIGDRLSPSALQ